MSTVDQLVRAVLYEGYALDPHRPSALENHERLAFGAVYPRAWAERAGEPWTMRAECVIDGGSAVAITLRFLVLHRGRGATEQSIALEPRSLSPASWREVFARPAGQRELAIALDLTIDDAGDGLWRVAVEIENRTRVLPSADREDAMDVTFVSTHTIFRAVGGTAVSTIDPPRRAAAAVAACRTLGTYAVVVTSDTVLASPIVLPDFSVAE